MSGLSIIYAKEDGILSEYLDYLYASGSCAVSTSYNYYMTLRSLAKFLRHYRNNMECSPEEVVLTDVSLREMIEITKDEWYAYLDFYEFKNKESSSSLSLRISVIRGFYRWLASSLGAKHISFILAAPSNFRKKQSNFTRVTEQMEEHICACLKGDNLMRNACIIHMLARLGLSLQEVCNLNMEDIELSSVIIRPTKKTRVGEDTETAGDRVLSLDDVLIQAINDYIAVRKPPKDGSNAFFVSSADGRLKRGALEKMLRIAVADAGPSYSNITIRDLQMTAKARSVEEHGVEEALQKFSIRSADYFAKTFAPASVPA